MKCLCFIRSAATALRVKHLEHLQGLD